MKCFIEIQVIKHHKLNTPENPCKSSPDYFYQECIEKKVISRIGCKPPWTNITTSLNETCTERNSIREYLKYMMAVNLLGTKALVMKYGCHPPCNYFEYKV